jgi:hypothetical protein
MSQFNLVKNSVSADQSYFDLTVTNFQNTTDPPQPFYYNEQRTLPFVSVPEDYYLSILRFTVETGSLPVFIPSIQPLVQQQANPITPSVTYPYPAVPTDINLTIYSVTLEYTDPLTNTTYTSQSYIQHIAQDTSVPVPTALGANGIQVNDNGYYNIYSYTFWIYQVWVAFIRAWGQDGLGQTAYPYGNSNPSLLSQLATAGVSIPQSQGQTAGTSVTTYYAPFINWDATSNTAVLTAQSAFCVNQATGTNPIKIYMNAPCFQLFNSFPARYLGYTNVVKGKNFQIELANVGGTNGTSITVPNRATPDNIWVGYTLYQEYPTIENWSPILAVVFVSNTLPIEPNNVSTPLVLNNNNQIVLGGNNADTANIITDLVSDTGNYRPNLVYLPSAQYRYVTLYGNRPLYNLDLSIFYRIKTGQLIPFTLNSGGCVTIKFAFIKKTSILSFKGGAGNGL